MSFAVSIVIIISIIFRNVLMISNIYKKITLFMSFFIIFFSAVQADQATLSTDINQVTPLTTKPVIVVSIEPLYEVVSTLSHGVVKPEVIYLNFNDINQPLSTRQQETLLSADIIIRVGRGFEPRLDDFLIQQGKALQNKTITLSRYIPLLEKENIRTDDQYLLFTDRQASSDLRFWMDPRLLRMLTDFIAPTLATMDPVHLEEYLDNEIVLRAQLKKVENKMMTLFKQLSLEQKLLLGQLNPYLKNRYLSFSDSKLLDNIKTVKPAVLSCIKNQSYSTIPLNLEYTEKTLNSLLYTIEQCAKSTVVSG